MSDTPDTTRLSESERIFSELMAQHQGDGFMMVDKYIILPVTEYNRLHADLARVESENTRLRKALDTVIAEAGAIWDDENPVHPAHGTGLDMMLFAARAALHNAAAAPGADGEIGE